MDNSFPDGFLWGASTSAHQVEGNNVFNDWWEWEISGGTEPSGEACDHYNRYRDDFRLAKDLGHNAHRLGIEWSRLEKQQGEWDQNEWDHYDNVIDELLRLGIEPVITLHHFTLPLWLARNGGWIDNDSPYFFERFATKAIERFGDRVQYWVTINEPNILAILAYYQGIWTPCRHNLKEAVVVLKNMLKAHSRAYMSMHGSAKKTGNTKTPKIGVAKAVTAFHPCRAWSPMDRLSTALKSFFHNYSFVRSAVKGRISLPGIKKEKLCAKRTLDFVGLNYYFRQFIHYQRPFMKNPLGEVCSLAHHKNAGKTTDMGWEIYPEGLFEVIRGFQRYGLPVIITENGLATKDDSLRQKYIKEHLRQIQKALGRGVPVKGYFHWSLIDNFEWADGYSKRFGLISVDYKTQQRTVTDAARCYASIIKTGKIPE